MFKLPVFAGAKPARSLYSVLPFAAVLLGSGLAGCAKNSSHQPHARIYQPAPQVAGYRQQHRVEVEDDGIEAQIPPPLHRRKVVDDPTEPFSPNYGRFSALKPNGGTASPVYVPNDLPDEFRAQLVSRPHVSPKL
ncbi:MAG: hypothetical protein K0U74_04915 [Alphaproteobacteria bacterium]|nr:hypothetical protein [Alphaproteobacteria bacterium]